MNMESIMNKLSDLMVTSGSKIILAVLIWIVGKIIIRILLKTLDKSRFFLSGDVTARSFILNFIKSALYVVLIVSIIGVLGVPMASVVTVLASAGVAVGLALQGALSNLAGGIMIMIFRPFKVGDYVDAAGISGSVSEVSLFYTTFISADNKRIIVPNGALMGANVVNYSSEPLRRVDLTFACGKGESPSRIQDIILQTMIRNPKVLKDPAPFARLSGGSNEAMEFTARAWCASDDYWDVYFDLTQSITEAFGENGVQAPSVRIKSEN